MKEVLKKNSGLIKLVAALIIFFYSGILLVLPTKLLGISVSGNQQLTYYLTFAANILRAILIFMLFFKELKRDFKPFKENFWEYSDVTIKYWIVGLFIMALSNALINIITPAQMANNEEEVRTMINAIPLLSLIMTTITAPLVEETVFRQGFKNVFKSKYIFILCSGIFFGAIHVVTADITTAYDYLYIIPYSALGIAFAATCWKTDNVYPSMMMHSIHNCAITLVTIIVTQVGMIIWKELM